MIKAAKNLFGHFSGENSEREIDEELRLHLDLLTEENCRRDMLVDEARHAALKRFGNVEQIKNQCVEISRRNQPVILALKSLFTLVFLGGVLVRVLGTDFHVTRVGDILIFVGVLSRVLLYLRSLSPARLPDEAESPLRLGLTDKEIETWDRDKRSPLERVISNK